ncbi:MAG: ligase-associated DNA damage response exonuclease [Pirellulaceae bacterium]|nr:ligase-associated DNA damage response exonuclease [Pirellulaceae bacterium]
MQTTQVIQSTSRGLYCEAGDFFIDPWRPVARAVITHAHSDHARWGSQHYLAAETNRHILPVRLGNQANIEFAPIGKPQRIGGVTVTFVPAGHILGSAQIVIEHRGEIVVVSGDYKRESDFTCQMFEPVRCHTFVTESTFGLPVYRWPDPTVVFEQINEWWRQNQSSGKASVLLAYALGKAQRLLAGIDSTLGPIYTHGAVEKLNVAYRDSGIALPDTIYASNLEKGTDFSRALIIAPPSTLGTPWIRRFGKISTGMASGWMQIRGTRRRRSMDRGFILSDHVDWNSLLQTIAETEAESIWVTHGYSDIVVRHLQEQGMHAKVLETEFTGESLDGETTSSVEEPA